MSRRIEQINELLRRELAMLIAGHLDISISGLITVIDVKTSPDLRYAKVNISVLPENQTGSALRELRKSNSYFSGELKKKLSLKFIPKFNWTIDANERYAAEIDRVIDELSKE